MSILQTCIGCHAKYKLEDRLRGHRMFCKRCHTVFTVGELAGKAAPAAAGTLLERPVMQQANGHNGEKLVGDHRQALPVPHDPCEESAGGAAPPVARVDVRATVKSAQDIAQMDLAALGIMVAELMGYSEIVIDDHGQMQALLDGLLVRVPNYVGDPASSNELLMRLEWAGVAYALRYEPVGTGDRYGFYLKGAQILGPSRAVAICKGFVLAAFQAAKHSRESVAGEAAVGAT